MKEENKEVEHSPEYLERVELIRLDKELAEMRHKFKMEELMTERENTRIFHEKELEKIRIKSAEIRRSQERKEHQHFANDYVKGMGQ